MRIPDPTCATVPTPGAPNELAATIATAHLMVRRDDQNQPIPGDLLAHQRTIARIGGERTPDCTRYRWPVVVLTMPRRAGKTVGVEAIEVTRSLLHPGHRTFYTAQSAADAWTAWKGLADVLKESPALAPQLGNIRYSNGSAEIPFRNGSSIHPFTPSPKALDGTNADLVIIDEAFAFRSEVGSLLMSSVGPTQLNRPNAQFWIISVAGSAESTWLREWVDKGRAAAGDPNSPIAFIDWSMPEGADPDDPDVWASFHPGYASGLTTLAGMQASRAKHTKAEWLRAYCNQWVQQSGAPFVSLERLDALGDDTLPVPDLHRATVAVDVAADGSAATIAAGWMHAGTPAGAIVQRGPGIWWLPDALADLAAQGATIIADPTGPTVTLLDSLPTTLAHRVRRVTSAEFIAACQALTTRVADSTLTLIPSPDLRAALTVAAGRDVRGTRVLDATHSPGPIDAARALALAINAAARPALELQVF